MSLTLNSNFNDIASSLSLAYANYKPVPQVKSQSSSSVAGARVGQVKDDNSRDPSLWGEPSVLHLPTKQGNGRNAGTDSKGSGKSVGHHGCTVLDDYTPKDSIHVEFPSYNSSRSKLMQYREQMGVNGGSWFVSESWMAPSLFDCAANGKSGEYDVISGYGHSKKGIQSARARLEKHWDTWITKKDFEDMVKMGINTFRLPVGYWNFPGANFTKDTPFEKYSDVYKNSWKYIERAIYWADKNDIGVIIDLHGAYGSQNGQPHSGLSNGKVEFFTEKNMDRTRDLLIWLTRRTMNITNVVGIEVLNEPKNHDKLWSWYDSTMDAIRAIGGRAKNMPLYFHDAFSPEQGAKFAGKRDDFVVQDTHSYFVYTQQDKDMDAKSHTSQIKKQVLGALKHQSGKARGKMVVGEWSCALNSKSLSNAHNKHKATSSFCQAQTNTYRKATAGVMFWSWNMENCKQNAGWCFKSALDRYMDKTYNAWGYSGTVDGDVLSRVSKAIKAAKMPGVFAVEPGSSKSCKKGGARDALVEQSSTHSSTKHASSTHSSSKDKRAVDGALETSLPRGGGLAARARAHVMMHRRTTQIDAIKRGFSDGFVTARALAEKLMLSRIGFTQQYLADTIDLYKGGNLLEMSKKAEYEIHFKKGLKKVEKQILDTLDKDN